MNYLSFVIITSIFIYFIIPLIIKTIIKKKLKKSILKRNDIFLTFDDGPNPEATPKILEILNNANIKATFFLKGKNIEKNPDLVNCIIRDGHVIGEHGYNHYHPWKTNPMRLWTDLVKCHKAFEKISKEFSVTLFRPPYGKLNLVLILYALLKKKRLFFGILIHEII
jgi:peptidoglycan/xylan/chitin deacetylase (PgdA/CDA1 family)